MREEIERVLADETLTTNDERVNAITQSLATLTIPKDKFNELNDKYKVAKQNYSTLSTEFDEFKKSKMTEDELREAEKTELATKVKNISIKESEYAVRDLFTEANIPKEKYEKILGKVVTDNKEQSVDIAKTFIELFSETVDETKKQTVTDLLNNTPKPNFGNPNAETVSNYDNYKAKYDEAVKNNDFIAQTTYMRLMQQEQMKKTK